MTKKLTFSSFILLRALLYKLEKHILTSMYYMGNEANFVLMNLVALKFIQYPGDDLDFLNSRCSGIGRQKLAKKAASVAVQVINAAWTICSPKQS